ncbi:hypothetical protein ABW19_dt0209922 [Dactylella cylindrospora]|nr:hypothetical protein ABW19_dt0209922 [Dactylella cylindrospora]
MATKLSLSDCPSPTVVQQIAQIPPNQRPNTSGISGAAPSVTRDSTTHPVSNNFATLQLQHTFANETPENEPLSTLDPIVKSFVESLPIELFIEASPEAGLTGMERYLATPKKGDTARHLGH